MTVLALSLVALTGCGGVVSSCSRAAIKVGSSSAGKGVAIFGTEQGARGVGIVGAHGIEQGAAKGAAGHAVLDAERGAQNATPLGLSDDAAKAGDEAAGQVHGDDSSLMEHLGQEAMQQGGQALIGNQTDSDDNRRPAR